MLPIALGGSILALLLVGAAGSYWADRRSREVRLLSSRGVGPGALALKAVLELALPAVVGTVLGWLAARWLVAALGPSPRLDRSAPWQAGLTALVALAAGLGLLALVAGLRSRAATERPVGSRRGWVALVPWELLLLAAAGGCWLRLRGSDAVTLDAGIAQINLLVVAFPLLFLAGAAVLTVRLLALLLPRLGRSSGRLSPAWYLAARRVGAGLAWAAVLLVYHRLDIDPTRLPSPLLTVPVVALAGSAAAVAVVVVFASFYAQRSADRADVSQVLRLSRSGEPALGCLAWAAVSAADTTARIRAAARRPSAIVNSSGPPARQRTHRPASSAWSGNRSAAYAPAAVLETIRPVVSVACSRGAPSTIQTTG